MSALELTRRTFCCIAGAGGVAVIAGCVDMGDMTGDGGGPGPGPMPDDGGGDVSNADDTMASGNGVVAFGRAGGGRRISNAAKKHNANRLYATSEAALGDPAHPGDNSKVVSVVISRERFDSFFGHGRTVVDLRRI